MKKKKVVSVLVIIILLIIGLTIGINASYSSFKSEVSGSVEVNAARFISTDNLNTSINLQIDNMIPGDEKTYNFNIKNFDNSIINEVKISYDIEIKTSNNLPLEFELYKGVDTINNVLNSDLKSLNNILNYGESQTDTYTLKINWDVVSNSEEYKDLTDYIDIIINSRQVVD